MGKSWYSCGIFQGDAGGLEAAGFGDVVCDAVGGFGVAQAFGADVGDAVALGVGAARARLPGEVDAEGVRRAESGALADEEHSELRVEELADVVGEGYSRILRERG